MRDKYSLIETSTSPTRRQFLCGAAAGALALGLPLSAPGAFAAEKVPLKVQLAWVRDVEQAGLWMALEKGWYEEAGLDVSIRDWSPTVEPIQAVAAGLATVGIASNGLSVASARGNGLPVKVIATHFQKSASGLVSKKAAGITEPAHLIGKTVGIPQTGRVSWDLFTAVNGLADKVTVRVVGFDLTPLLTDQVDALLAFSTNQPIVLASEGIETNFMYFADHSAPRYDNAVFTTDAQLANDEASLVKWIAATRKGWQYVFEHPEEAVDLVIAKHNDKVKRELQLQKLAEQARLMLPEGSKGLLWMDEAVWDEGIKTMQRIDLLPASFQLRDLVTLDPLSKSDAG